MKDEKKRSEIVGDHLLEGQNNYENWSACVKNYLMGKDMWYVVEDTTSKRKRGTKTKAWQMNNKKALHAIQISCDPTMIAYIKDMDTAKDAWNTLAEKCQQPVSREKEAQMPADDSTDPPAGVAVVRTDTLKLVHSIKRSDLQATNDHLWANRDLIKNADVHQWTGRRPLHFAVMAGNFSMIEMLLVHMSDEDLKIKDSMGRTALQYVAWNPENTEIADILITRNEELLIIEDKLQYIPLNYACLSGNKVMSQHLYKKTKTAFLRSPENRNQAASFLRQAIGSKLFDLALDLLKLCPDLALANHVDREGKNKGNAVLALSSQPSAFLSSSGLSFWQRSIYSCLKAKQLSSDIEVRINTHKEEVQKETETFVMQGSRAKQLSSDIEACIDTHKQEVQKETETFVMQVERKLLGLRSNLLKFFGIYDLMLNHDDAHKLLRLMSEKIAGLDAEQILKSQELIYAIFNASRLGMQEFLVEIIKTNPDLLEIKDKDFRSIFHVAVVYRQEKVFSLIYGLDSMRHNFPTHLDMKWNNMLHLAGQLEPKSQPKLDQISGAALQMQRELQWFKEVERIVPPSYKEYRNKKGETPYQAFDRSHADLLKSGEKWMKDIAQSSTIVGTLIIAMMFAALFTAPEGNKKLLKLFIISDAISFFASSTSVLTFVGILTSRYSRDDFLVSLPRKLIIGLSALFISIAAMMVAFCSAVIVMVKGQLEIVIPIVLLAAIPVCLFMWLQFPLLFTTIISTYGPGIFDRKMKKWL